MCRVFRLALTGLICGVVLLPMRSEAQSARGMQTNAANTESSQNSNKADESSPDSKSSRDDRSAPDQSSPREQNGNEPNDDSHPTRDLASQSENGRTQPSTIQSMISDLSANVIEFMQRWESGPDELVPQFMATEDEINAALSKVLNRADHKP